LKEGGNGEERVREGSIRGRPERDREREAREVKVSAGSSEGVRWIMHGRGELGRTRLHKLAHIAMMSSIAGWPPVDGHPAMEVVIEVQF
jgi:hypothetical protein